MYTYVNNPYVQMQSFPLEQLVLISTDTHGVHKISIRFVSDQK